VRTLTLIQIRAKDAEDLKTQKATIGADKATMLKNINTVLKAQGLSEATRVTSKDAGVSGGAALSSPAWGLIVTAHLLVLGLLG